LNTLIHLKKWVNNITDTLVILIVLILLVEILLGQTNIPFIGSFDLTQQIINIVQQMSLSNTSAGIVFIWIIFQIYSLKKN
jgi:hypothetical protein|tara:strand:- start:1307 stop:1549 length:243 start_codon:yes stop_codon:yes gene_type:complete